jgi:hypothetical protein
MVDMVLSRKEITSTLGAILGMLMPTPRRRAKARTEELAAAK